MTDYYDEIFRPGGAAGAMLREHDRRLERQQMEMRQAREAARAEAQMRRQQNAATVGMPAIGTSVATGSPLTAKERQQLKKRQEERKADELDGVFAGLVALAALGLGIYVDVQAAVSLPWYGHLLFVLTPAVAVYWSLWKMRRLTRLLRWAFQWGVVCLIIALALRLFGY